MTEVNTYTATIWVGRKNRDTQETYDLSLAEEFLQKYVEKGLCITLTETKFIYSFGNELGFNVGLINYPRFPTTSEKIEEDAIAIAQGLKDIYKQFKVTIVFPNKTVMLSTEPNG